MEYVVAVLAVVAFGYLIYRQVEAAKKRRKNYEHTPYTPGGGGGGGKHETQVEK